MQTIDELMTQLTSACEHLYDIAWLRAHPIAQLVALVAVPADATKDRAWQTHHALIKMMDELNPAGRAPALSREWRKHRLMRLRYVDGLPPQEVADALAVSRRQYYRVHDEAMRSMAEMLFTQRDAVLPVVSQEREQLLRTEMERHARATQQTQHAILQTVLDSTLSLLHDRLSQRGVRVQPGLAANLPMLRADDKLFRQLLLGVMGYLVERVRNTTLDLSAQTAPGGVQIDLMLSPALQHDEPMTTMFDELAALNGARVLPIHTDDMLSGFSIVQPAIEGAHIYATTVLIVDDNEDTLELYRRYLTPHDVAIATARNSAEVFDALLDARPHIIFLDLMLPEQDGWDILQLLKNEPDAREIPVFICSVLKQKELALSLGATGFIEKPFTKEALLNALKNAKYE